VRLLLRHPARAAVSGAIAIAFSGILYKAADVSPSTGAFFRCAYALPALWIFVRLEERLIGPRPWHMRKWAWLAGAFFAADLLFWHHSIEAVGAGLATVLGNTQVVMVGLLAWALFGERPSNRALVSIPIAMVGVVLISGVLEDGAYGDNPKLGVVLGLLTGASYSGFLLALRHGAGERQRVAGPLFDATLVSAVLILPFGLATGDLDLTPGPEAQAWLIGLALSAQVVGWLLITVSLPRLPAVVTSILLTLQPVATVVLAAILIDEEPSPLQLLGAATILSGLLLATVGRRAAGPEPVPERA
jgi:drug/metabolite transporter (DMT)-like permease